MPVELAPLTQELQEATALSLRRAMPLLTELGKRLPEVEVRFDLRGLSAGQVVWMRNSPTLIRYNLAIAQANPEQFIAKTVPHEVAHVITRIRHPRSRPHGGEWRKVMAYLGIPQPKRCHDFDLTNIPTCRQRRWSYRCGCTIHQISTTRHHRIQTGAQQYLCRICHQPLRRNIDTP